jgi:hypothetical protein
MRRWAILATLPVARRGFNMKRWIMATLVVVMLLTVAWVVTLHHHPAQDPCSFPPGVAGSCAGY